MVQFRRLDPLAKAGPWQRATKRGVKTFTITQEQYDQVSQRRPQLIISGEDSVLLCRPYRDFLQVHYAYSEVPAFREEFKGMLKSALTASSREEAPRGVVLAFRDRPNRPIATQLFWEIGLEESKHWVEVEYTSIPEMEAPANDLDGGYRMREATAADRDAVATVESDATGLPRLSDAGLDSLYESARWLYVAENSAGKAVALLALRREDAGWATIDECLVVPEERAALHEPLARWALAFLRSNGGRRQRRRVNLEDDETLQMLRGLGYAPGESGVDYVRPVEDTDIQQKHEDLKAKGTIIKFGDWR